MMEQSAQRLDNILKKSRVRRQNAEKHVKEARSDKVYFCSLKKEQLDDAKQKRDRELKQIEAKGLSDFAKLMDAGEKGENLFDVGHYKIIKNSSRNKSDT